MLPFWLFLYGNNCMQLQTFLKSHNIQLVIELDKTFTFFTTQKHNCLVTLLQLHSIHAQLVSIHYLSQELYNVGYMLILSVRVRRKRDKRKYIDKTQRNVCLRHLHFWLRELKMEIEKQALLTRPDSGLALLKYDDLWQRRLCSESFSVCLSGSVFICICLDIYYWIQAAKVLHCEWHLIRKDNKTEVFTFQDDITKIWTLI